MRHIYTLLTILLLVSCARSNYIITTPQGERLTITALSDNAVRVQYSKEATHNLPEWIYQSKIQTKSRFQVKNNPKTIELKLKELSLIYDKESALIQFYNPDGNLITQENAYSLIKSQVQGEPTYIAELQIDSPDNEYLYGLGQFQDGYLNVRGLTRRLTQVNSQISIPMLISNRGYALVWNNYGMMDFNPADQSIVLNKKLISNEEKAVNVTSTEGSRKEMRRGSSFSATLDISKSGKYALLLDVGQSMARSHHLCIDGDIVMDMHNTWLPPTSSAIVELSVGTHIIEANLENNDKPILYYKLIDNQTTYRSPVASAIDFCFFAGDADKTISTYRRLSGNTPMLPDWAFGYTHCRERYHSSDEILENANKFRNENLPLDIIVQDWQYWGKYGWNAMRFDEEHYPDPKALTDSLHRLNTKFMLSVWSKIDDNSQVGQQMKSQNYYIDNTTWIDFFNPDAAAAYWENFNNKLVPLGIDAWWQDATEPENDDLLGRKVCNNSIPGEVVRNTYPLLVSKTVYEGLRKSLPNQRALILTRCAFLGSQRYASIMWSGDVGNDWETLKRQIVAGLGFNAAGMPWWTYDAGGFFRPWTQYSDTGYKERMLRWLQTSVFLPMMRVHGYMSNTEFWNYGEEVVSIARKSLDLRYKLFPYIYSAAYSVSRYGGTMMRPLVMDFCSDIEALKQNYEYMFGHSLLVAPVLEESINSMKVYLPKNDGGWYNFESGEHYDCGYIDAAVDMNMIPVFARSGSIVALANPNTNVQSIKDVRNAPLEIRVYAGGDARFELYEDDGENYDYEKGQFATTTFEWNDLEHTMKVSQRKGQFSGIKQDREYKIVLISENGIEESSTYTLSDYPATIHFFNK